MGVRRWVIAAISLGLVAGYSGLGSPAYSAPTSGVARTTLTVAGFNTASVTALTGSRLTDPITVSGGARPVTVQFRAVGARTWTTAASGRTTRRGAYTVVESVRQGSWQWRVYVPRFGRFAAATSGLRIVVGKSATSFTGFSTPASFVAGTSPPVPVRVLPPTRRTVVLQSRTSSTGAWVTRETTLTALNGWTTLHLVGATAGSAQWRAYAPVTGAAFAGATPAHTVTVVAATAASMQVSGIANAVAGTAQTISVTIVDNQAAVAVGYTGTVHFTSNDPAASLPSDYTFTALDHGTHQFASAVVLKTAGLRSVTVSDTVATSLTSHADVNVSPQATSALHLTGLVSGPIGARSVTVSAVDPFGNITPDFVGTVHFTSSDSNATLPPDYTFTPDAAGTHVFASGVSLPTVGDWTVTVADITNPLLTDTLNVTVSAGAATHFRILGVADSVAGTPFSVTVTALDAQGNRATAYQGTVHFSSGDGAALLPTDFTFASGDTGEHVFTGLQFRTAGNQHLTVADLSDASVTVTQSASVTPGSLSTFVVATATSTTAGLAQSMTVRAVDSYGNTSSGYVGVVHVSSNDPQAILPADLPFLLSDAGTRTLSNSVTLATVGLRTITASDVADPTLSGTSPAITVGAGAAAAVHLTGVTSAVAGTAQTVAVTMYDAFGNVASGYAGTVHISSTDPAATLPVNYQFTPADSGSHTFVHGVSLTTAAATTLTVVDVNTASLTDTTSPVTISAGSAAHVQVTGLVSAIAGAPQSPRVTVRDSYNNLATGYRGTIVLTSSDAQAVLPAAHTFTGSDGGDYSFTSAASLRTAGTMSVTATDSVAAALAGSQSTSISAGPAATLTVSGLTDGSVGNRTVTVQAHDTYANLADSYRGTVHFTSSDLAATLPSDYAYTPADGGAHQFTVSLATSGTQSVTVSDAVANVSGQQSAIIAAAPTSQFQVTGLVGAAAGTAQNITVTAIDALGHTAGAYRGTVTFTSTDGIATLPLDYTFTASDSGVHTFSGVILQSSGQQTVTVTDSTHPAIAGTSDPVTITSGDANTLQLAGLTDGPIGSRTVVVTALDAFGNVATTYRGKVEFSSTDPASNVPADYTFTASDLGTHTFVAGFHFSTVGVWSVTALDNTAGIGVSPEISIT